MNGRVSTRAFASPGARTAALALGLGLLFGGTARAQCSLCRDAVASASSEVREAMNYAIIGLAAHNESFVFMGVGDRPRLFTVKDLQKGKQALGAELKPSADLYNSPETKLHLAGVLMERAWNTLST